MNFLGSEADAGDLASLSTAGNFLFFVYIEKCVSKSL